MDPVAAARQAQVAERRKVRLAAINDVTAVVEIDVRVAAPQAQNIRSAHAGLKPYPWHRHFIHAGFAILRDSEQQQDFVSKTGGRRIENAADTKARRRRPDHFRRDQRIRRMPLHGGEQGAAGILPAERSEKSTAGKMPAAPWRCRLTLVRGSWSQCATTSREGSP